MDVTLYNTPTDTEHVIKDLQNADPRTGTVRGSASVDSMEFDVVGDVTDANYCHIPKFRRFYWITDRNVYRSGITTLTLKSDPLMSFYSGHEESGHHVDGIEDLGVYITRCSVGGKKNGNELQIGFNAYLTDDGVPVLAKTRYEMILDDKLKFDFNDEVYYLVTVG